MPENFIEGQQNLTVTSRIKKFYESNKIFVYSLIIILIILFGSFNFYLEKKEQKRFLLSENYIQAKFHLEKGNKKEALIILKELTYAKDSTYSVLSFFLILDQRLISANKEISIMYDYIIENNKFEKELRNLLIYKKALFSSNFVSESKLLEITKPLLKEDTLWKPHALLLLGDYFISKGENIKAIEFYQQILSIKNLQRTFYDQAKAQLLTISNE
jgi:predicted negative regulator of RcsB-dependent stress response